MLNYGTINQIPLTTQGMVPKVPLYGIMTGESALAAGLATFIKAMQTVAVIGDKGRGGFFIVPVKVEGGGGGELGCMLGGRRPPTQ